MTDYWVLNEAEIALEDFGSEFIVVHFRKGIYSAVSGSGGAILTLLSEPRSVSEIVATFPSLDGNGAAAAAEEVGAFLDVLKDQELIVSAEKTSSAAPGTVGAPYEAPSIETFTDLADLMAIDPVHEVESGAGWPHQPKTSDA